MACKLMVITHLDDLDLAVNILPFEFYSNLLNCPLNHSCSFFSLEGILLFEVLLMRFPCGSKMEFHSPRSLSITEALLRSLQDQGLGLRTYTQRSEPILSVIWEKSTCKGWREESSSNPWFLKAHEVASIQCYENSFSCRVITASRTVVYLYPPSKSSRHSTSQSQTLHQ